MSELELTTRQRIAYTKAITLLVRNEKPDATPEERDELIGDWLDHPYAYVMAALDYNKRMQDRLQRRRERAQKKVSA